MPKKKQVIFTSSIPGKFIPRDDLPPASVFRSGINDNRFNAKMAELYASSSNLINDENELVSTKTAQEEQPLPSTTTTVTNSELTSIDSSGLHANLLHRRIATMLETLKKTSEEPTPSLPTSQIEQKSQPITFGQLRQATLSSSSSSSTILDDKSNSQHVKTDREEKHLKTWTAFKRDSCPDLSSVTKKSPGKSQTNKERFYYSPSLERLLEEQNVHSQTKKEEEQSPKSTVTVDEILAMYYSKANQSINQESHLSSSNYSNTSTRFYIHPSGPRWSSSLSNLHNIPTQTLPPRLVLNEQNRNRPPPPSYSSSISQSHRTTSTKPNTLQRLVNRSIPPTILEHLYPNPYGSTPILTENASTIHSNSTPSLSPTILKSLTNNSIRPPPPRYVSPSSDSDHLQVIISTVHDSTSSSQQKKSTTNNINPGFDREFSRLLYGKDSTKNRRQKHRRKAYSDPIKKAVEEAVRSMEKAHRRVTTHLNKAEVVKEEDDNDNDDTESDRSNIGKQDLDFLPRRRFQRQSDLLEKTRESARKAIVPPNPLLKRRIPSFLRVYSQASSSNDILLQWHLFNLSELESFYTMMTRLYKNENLARVQLYEIYRTVLLSALASKTSSSSSRNSNAEKDSITTSL